MKWLHSICFSVLLGQQKCKELKRETKTHTDEKLLKRPGASRQVVTRRHLSQPSDRSKSNSGERIKKRDVGGESGARLAEWGCSVTAAPFTRPVSPVFVTSDVSIKTAGRHQKQTDLHPYRPPSNAPRHLSPATLPQTPSVFSPSSLWCVHTNQRVRLSPGPRSEYKSQPGRGKKRKKKSSGKEQKLESCPWLMIFIRIGDVRKRWNSNPGLLRNSYSRMEAVVEVGKRVSIYWV